MDVSDGPGPSIASPACAKQISFLQEAFGAILLNVWPETAMEDGKPIIHATLYMSGGLLYIFDASTFDTNCTAIPNGTSCSIALTAQAKSGEDAKRMFEKAQALGATVTTELKKWFWQSHDDDLFGGVRDPWGFRWVVNYERPEARAEFDEKMRTQIKEARAKAAAAAAEASK